MYSFRMPAVSALRAALLVGFAAIAFFAFSQSAMATNTVSSAVYSDQNGDGTVDRVTWTMDENTSACAYEAGDWTVNTAGTVGLTITGVSCSGTEVRIAVSGTANVTGGSTAPVISYANQGTAGSITLASGAMTAKNSQSTTDGAAPVVVSTSPASAATGVTISSDIVITFSEAMDTGFVEGTEFSMSPDPGTFSAAWTVSNSVVTLSFPNMICGTTYTLTTTEAEIIASAGSVTTLVTTGPQDGDWSSTLPPVAPVAHQAQWLFPPLSTRVHLVTLTTPTHLR